MRGPPPLRSHAYPEGLPGLTGVSKTRVAQANKLYDFCRRIMDVCEELHILCIAENPESSLFLGNEIYAPEARFFSMAHSACLYVW